MQEEGGPTLWGQASGAPSTVSMMKAGGAGGKICVRLHPLLLLKCRIVGEALLKHTIALVQHHVQARLALAGSHCLSSPGGGGEGGGEEDGEAQADDTVSAQPPAPIHMLAGNVARPAPLDAHPLGFRANGLEDLMLLEVRRVVPNWSLGPTEKGLYEKEVLRDNRRLQLPKGTLGVRINAVRTLPQLCNLVAVLETRMSDNTPWGMSMLGRSPAQQPPPPPFSGADWWFARSGGRRLLPFHDEAGICRELVFCLAQTSLSTHDVPGILKVMGWNGKQVTAPASDREAVKFGEGEGGEGSREGGGGKRR